MNNIHRALLVITAAALTLAVPFIVNPRLFAGPCAHTKAWSVLCPLGQTSCTQCVGAAMCPTCTATVSQTDNFNYTPTPDNTYVVQGGPVLCNKVFGCKLDTDGQTCLIDTSNPKQPVNAYNYTTTNCPQ